VWLWAPSHTQSHLPCSHIPSGFPGLRAFQQKAKLRMWAEGLRTVLPAKVLVLSNGHLWGAQITWSKAIMTCLTGLARPNCTESDEMWQCHRNEQACHVLTQNFPSSGICRITSRRKGTYIRHSLSSQQLIDISCGPRSVPWAKGIRSRPCAAELSDWLRGQTRTQGTLEHRVRRATVEGSKEEMALWRRAFQSWVLKDEWSGKEWEGRAQGGMMAQ
jgi:hypothetical protein